MAERPEPGRGARTAVEVGGRRLTVTNLDKVLYPATETTKGEVLHYYARIAPVLLGHLDGRPVTRVRFPDGVEGLNFFEKKKCCVGPVQALQSLTCAYTIPSAEHAQPAQGCDHGYMVTGISTWTFGHGAIIGHRPQRGQPCTCV